MVFKYTINKNIPCLSWLVKFQKGNDVIEVITGEMVETFEDFFVAGVWDGDFTKGNFESSHCSCCTGAKLNNDSVIFSTPHHLQESIFSIQEKDRLFLSNSLAFLLTATNNELNPYYKDYEADMCSILYGIESKKLKKSSPLSNNKSFNYHRCCNLIIDKNLFIDEQRKYSNLSFSNYNDYKNKVISILKNIKSNSTHPERKCQYGSITTISQGYDAPAASVFAKEMDCNEVYTFIDNPADDGSEIAKILGYENIYRVNAKEYISNTELLEAEALASGNSGSTFIAFPHLLKNKIFIMGDRGDSLFERLHNNVNDNLDFHEGNGFAQASLTVYENLLKNNTISLYIPMIGCDKWSDLSKISQSEEMQPWSIRNYYDRPIPRRLLEESNVKRDMFGKEKIGAGISYSYDTIKRIRNKMSSLSYQKLLEFDRNFPKKKWNDIKYIIRFYHINFPIYANYILNRFKIKSIFKCNSEKIGMVSNPISTLLLCWGISEMKKRYKI